MKLPKITPPKAEAQVINKNEAQDWLNQTADFQRKVNNKVSQYKRDMDGGKWIPWVAHIAFDKRGRLINGQHVLTAFLRSDLEELAVLVSTGHESDAYGGFDKNRTRSAADDLRTLGRDKATEIAKVGKILWQYFEGVFDGKGYMAARTAEKIPTPAETVETVEKFPGLENFLMKNPHPGTGVALVELRAVAYLLHQWDRPKAEEFMEMVTHGIAPSIQHPVAVLCRSIRQSGGARWRHGETLAHVFKAWKAYIGECPAANFRRGEAFPLPSYEAIAYYPQPEKPKKGPNRIQ